MARTLGAAMAALALTLSCKCESPAARTASDDPGSAIETVRFQLFGDGAELDAYRELARAFEAQRPNTRVELTPVANQRDFMAKLTTSFAAGTPPDLFLINYRRYGQYASRGALEPLGPRLAKSNLLREADLYPQAVEAFRFDGELLCVPQNISSLVVYFNRAHFQDAGVPLPHAAWTWDEFADAAWKLTRDQDGDGRAEQHGVGFEPYLPRLAPFVWQAGGEVVDDLDRPTRLTLGQQKSMRGMAFAWSLRRLLRVTPSLEEVKAEDLERRFVRGTLSMFFNSRRLTPSLRGVANLDWDVAPLPRDANAATVLHSDAYCIAKPSKVKDAAFAFIEFAVGPEGGAIIARSGRTVPSHRALAQSEAFLQPQQRPASARVFLDSIPDVRRLPNIAQWHEVETRVDPELEEWFYGFGNETTGKIFEWAKRRHLDPRPHRDPLKHMASIAEIHDLHRRLDAATLELLAGQK